MAHRMLMLAAAALAATLAGSVLAAPEGKGKDTTPPALLEEARTLDALAARDEGRASQRIAGSFTDFAGSEDNAEALVRALRTGETVELANDAPPNTTTTFDPETGRTGWGNVFISLALAKESLAQAGVTEPTAAQIEAALNGGTITVDNQPVVLSGILAQRADGMGWGQIANGMGVKLGHVISAIRSENKSLGAAAGARTDKAARGLAQNKGQGGDGREHAARFTGHGEGTGAANRTARVERMDRPQRPDVANRGGGRDR